MNDGWDTSKHTHECEDKNGCEDWDTFAEKNIGGGFGTPETERMSGFELWMLACVVSLAPAVVVLVGRLIGVW
jgi:hypothetical protein